MRKYTKYIALVIVGIAFIIVGSFLVAAGKANALPDVTAPHPGHFVADLNATGVFSIDKDGAQTALLMGLGVCVDLFNGTSQSDLYQQVSSIEGFTPKMAQALMDTAQKDLCPKTLQVTSAATQPIPQPIAVGTGVGGVLK